MNFLSSLIQYKWIIVFYLLIASIVYFNRKKFDIQAKFIAMYRTKFGIAAMERFSSKYSEWLKILGYCSIGIGFIGMFAIVFTLLKNLFDLLTVPDAVSGVSLVLPGVHVPGSPIFIPFWFGIIALFIVVVFHEFGHGIIALAHKNNIKNTGIVFFGPLIGAFVEPDEKKLASEKDVVKYSIFASGPFFNVLLALIVVALTFVLINPIILAMTEPAGFSFAEADAGLAAYEAGLRGGMIIDQINGKDVLNYEQFTNAISLIKSNETIVIRANGTEYSVITGSHPDNPAQGYLGIKSLQNEYELKTKTVFTNLILGMLMWFEELFQWIYLLSLGIGLANLLPLGPVDGGRMLQTAFENSIKNKEKANRLWIKVSVGCLAVLLLNLFFPLIKWFFQKLIAI